MSIFFHEQLYRTDKVMAKLKEFPVTICGAGALGANLTENLTRAGFAKLKVIDRDRIEERNLSTQPYYRSDVGALELLHESRRESKFKVNDRCNQVKAQPKALAPVAIALSQNPKNLELAVHMLRDYS